METPVEIDFQGMTATPELQTSIEQHVAKLEQRYGRATACRVVVKGPGGHHRTGNYEIHIRIALPNGREVDISRVPSADERYTDLDFAINDSFKHARRQLQDQVRKLQGKVKRHEGSTATVVRLDDSGQFGFLEAGDGREIYFHRNSVLNDAFNRLEPGARVLFAEERGEKGPQASTVRLLGKHKLRT